MSEKELKEIDDVLKGYTGDANVIDLDVSTALSSLAIKLLDTVSQMYQIHNNVVRLGQNLDIMVARLNEYRRDSSSRIDDLNLRLDDLEKLIVMDLETAEE